MSISEGESDLVLNHAEYILLYTLLCSLFQEVAEVNNTFGGSESYGSYWADSIGMMAHTRKISTLAAQLRIVIRDAQKVRDESISLRDASAHRRSASPFPRSHRSNDNVHESGAH